ncbi:MAG: phosphoribosylanthranilate isomerase [Pseudomonadota bacterium]
MTKPELIKICGLSTPEAVDAVIAGGATHMGLIFFEKSPRHVSTETAAELSNHAGNRITKVAVSVDADDTYLDEIVAEAKPDMLQLHGSETPERVKELKSRYGLPVIKVIAIREADDLEKAQDYVGVADMFLFDAKPPKGSELPGGNGVAFDWEIMDQWSENVPYILSGGLDAGNIAEAQNRSGAKAVDVSSGVESAPGRKDPNLIREFLEVLT